MIKGIVFDLDGVYFQNGKKNFIRKVSDKFNIDRNIVADIFLKSDLMTRYKGGEIKGDDFWKNAIKIWKIKSTPKELIGILKEGYEVNDSAKKLIQEIRNKGFKTIICSNNFLDRIKILNEKFNFLEDFDFVILSYEYNILKPELFKKIPEITKFSEKEIIIIDDSPDLIKKAKEIGFNTILCDDPNKIARKLEKYNL